MPQEAIHSVAFSGKSFFIPDSYGAFIKASLEMHALITSPSYRFHISICTSMVLQKGPDPPQLRPSSPSFVQATPFRPDTHSGSCFRLHMPRPPQPNFYYDPHLSDKRSLLRAYLRTEPLLQLHLQESAELYNVCASAGPAVFNSPSIIRFYTRTTGRKACSPMVRHNLI